jgi:hypothetical protein
MTIFFNSERFEMANKIENKINIFKYENSKWRPNLRWTSKPFYWLKLENIVFF